jgi:hypothetical protein
VPSPKALRDPCRRIGAAPVKALFEVSAEPLGQQRTPGMFRGDRSVSLDGCRTVKIPDSADLSWPEKMNPARGVTGYPVIQVMTRV